MRLTALFAGGLFILAGALYGIDPSPMLRAKIASGMVAPPYYMQHEARLRALGVEAPLRSFRLQKGGLSPAGGALAVPTGDWNVLVLLVDFPDTMSQTEATFFDSLIYSTTGPSVQDYFLETSYGRLNITTVTLPGVTGWTRADSTHDYYVNSQNGLGNTYPRDARRLVEDLVLAVDSLIDFTPFDNDRDGYVDALFVVHAGTGAEWTGSSDHFWSHAWATTYDMLVDSVKVRPYAMQPEYWETPGDMTLGVFAHELAHTAFDVPDLYDRDDLPSRGLGYWTLLAAGAWLGPGAGYTNFAGGSPALPDAWSRIRMGYGVPQVITAGANHLPLAPATLDSTIYRLWTGGISTGDQYYLVENRQQMGYDSYLLGAGMLIYYIDEAMGHFGNDKQWIPGQGAQEHYLVALMQADGQYHLERDSLSSLSDDAGDPYPGWTGNTAFGDHTSPSARTYSGALSGISISNIIDTGDTVWADYGFGLLPAEVTIDSVIDRPDDNGGYFVLHWPPVPADTVNSADLDSYTVWWEYAVVSGASVDYRRFLNDGGWVPFDTIAATAAGQYIVEVPTAYDLSATGATIIELRVSANYADGHMTFSDPATGFSWDDLPPDTVRGLTVDLDTKGAILQWLPITSEPVSYEVYLADVDPVVPDTATFVAATADTTYTIPPPAVGGTVHITVLAVDQAGNQGAAADAVSITFLEITGNQSGVPARFALRPNHPNPFNPSTVIPFDVATAGLVTITVHDLTGREVAQLIDRSMSPGSYRAIWAGFDATGRAAPSGIYFVRMTAAGGYTATHKAILIR
ncbi:MAG: M6 family metalloprotease domain-containing protein [Candidatus Marinimicrobia bacterium]|nr:M6 family metalloprotease domain-containing protein [Candidatus Neomarinimicrobiota bacterium]